MKKSKITIGSLVFLMLLTVACKKEKSEYLAEEVEVPSCVLTATEFNSWFATGTATENGAVNNANSVDFVHNNNCDFYKWSEQMFLWITSSTNGETVMESPTFYIISPLIYTAKDTTRILEPHVKGTLLRAMANVDKTGKINSEEGQATDDVLMDKNGNLIYYISMANDVYAEFLTASKQGKMSGKKFPTTAQERDSIFNFAKANGVDLKDANALAIEIKTSWVIADSLIDTSQYITIDAVIPVYTKNSDNTIWTISGERQAKLAMVGMHIVGSASGHPEMVWATFEHTKNTPNDAYQYINEKGETVTVPADGDGDWLFNTNVKDSANVSHMKFKNDQIIAKKGHTISPSNTTRTKPWGSSYETQPNAEDATPAIANSKVIQLNKAISTLLPGNDVRKKYFLIGATWTNNGTAPNGISYAPNTTVDSVAIGSSQLANSTMETYAQNGTTYNKYGSCFSCHSNNGLKPTDLSHVYKRIQPLTRK